jgi:putative tryptophan/tyrosine transport system substrate-binding protein
MNRRMFLGTVALSLLAPPLAAEDDPPISPAAGGRGDRVMERRIFLGVIAGGLLAAPLAAGAQQPGRAWRVGFLDPTSSANRDGIEAFWRGLRELGYLEGRDVIAEGRWAENRTDRFRQLVAEVLGLKVDVVVVAATPFALAVKDAVPTIPVVFWGVGDPVGAGLVQSLNRPGGNFTGISQVLGEGFTGKWVQLTKDVVPRAVRVAVLVAPSGQRTSPPREAVTRDMSAAGRSLGVKLLFRDAAGVTQLDEVLSALARDRVDALIVTANPLYYQEQARIVEFAANHRLPTILPFNEAVNIGGLVSYGASITYMVQRAAWYVDKIFKGAQPGDLPVEQPTKFDLVINLKTAKALGLTIPQSLLQRADQVIE